MASEEQLRAALLKAAKAGDDNAAKIIGKRIKEMRANANPDAAAITSDPKYAALMAPVDPAIQDRFVQQSRNVREYDEQPEWKKPLIAMDDTVRNAADGMTFGFADKAAAMLSPGDYDENLAGQRDATQAAADRSGLGPEMIAKLAGGLTTGGLATKAGVTASKIIPEGTGLMTRLLSAAGIGGAEGLGYGALDAAGHDQDISDGALTGMAVGAGTNTVAEGALSALGGILSKYRGTNKAPSSDELTTQRKAAYKTMEDMEAAYKPQAVKDLADKNQATIVDIPGGAREFNHGATLDKLQEIRDQVPTTPTGKISKKAKPVGMYELDEIRKTIRNDLTEKDTKFGGKLINNIDEMMADVDPSKVTSVKGTPQEALDSLLAARNTSKREAKVGELEEVLQKAQRQVDRNATGDTQGNPLRQKVSSILDSDTRASQFSPDELARLDEIVKGTRTGNLARKVAHEANSDTGKYGGAAVGGAIGNMVMPGWGTIPGLFAGRYGAKLIGDIAEGISTSSTKKGVKTLRDDIARGRPKVPSRKEVPVSQKDRDLATRLLLMMQLQDSIGAKD